MTETRLGNYLREIFSDVSETGTSPRALHFRLVYRDPTEVANAVAEYFSKQGFKRGYWFDESNGSMTKGSDFVTITASPDEPYVLLSVRVMSDGIFAE